VGIVGLVGLLARGRLVRAVAELIRRDQARRGSNASA
jgi:hypothetical protein